MLVAQNTVILALWNQADSEALRGFLEATGYDVREAADARAALELASTKPAVVILDVDWGQASALLTCRLLREQLGEGLPVVFMSSDKHDVTDRVAGLLLGADEYLVKPLDPNELVARIRRLVVRSTINSTDDVSRPGPVDLDTFGLTAREREVMTLLIQGLTQQEIARTLVISSNTVGTHIQRILLKLGVHTRAQAVAKVARANWLHDAAPDAVGAHQVNGRSSPHVALRTA
jgi:two-component system nitrate/nitrite response regulator NarL